MARLLLVCQAHDARHAPVLLWRSRQLNELTFRMTLPGFEPQRDKGTFGSKEPQSGFLASACVQEIEYMYDWLRQLTDSYNLYQHPFRAILTALM